MNPTPADLPFVVEHVNGDVYAFDNIRKITDHHLEGNTKATVIIHVATALLGVLAAGVLFVSFRGQYTYLFTERHQQVPAGIEAAMLDAGMAVFTLLALGQSWAGKPSRSVRALILACSAASAVMNYAAANAADLRSVIAYTAPPVFLAVVIDRVVATIRSHTLGIDEASAWTTAGRAVLAVARLAGLAVQYSLRFAVDAPATAKGLRQGIINAAPLPPALTASTDRPELPAPDEGVRLCNAEEQFKGVCTKPLPCPDHTNIVPAGPRCWCTNPLPCLVHGTDYSSEAPTKKTRFLVLYRGHKDYGDKTVASAVARELAPLADLQWGTARSYIGEELTRIEAAS